MRINTVRLRGVLGGLAILLPWIVALLNGGFPASISATYYVPECITPFMGILIASSVILMCYKGYDLQDDIILSLSGLMGLCICLFPTYTSTADYVGTFHLPVNLSSTLHNVSAIIFFALLSYNSFFLFTKGDGNPTNKKKIRNIIYRICGVGMIASFLLLLLPDFHIKIWLMETIALFFFGVSFLTKADIFPFLFCDTPYTD
jgi:hypothetical protein